MEIATTGITMSKNSFNPFVPNAVFLYPPKTSENRAVFSCLQGVEKGYTGKKWVNKSYEYY